MRFLVTSLSHTPPPPEAAPALMEGLVAWAAQHKDSGKFVEVWGLVGLPGGGAIADVESLVELDEIMAGFPMGPFSQTQIAPIIDLPVAIGNARKAQEAMAQAMGGGG